MIVVDTNVISELMRQQPAPAVVAWMNAQRGSDLFLTAITIAEINYGLAALPNGKRKQQLQAACRRIVQLAFSSRILDFDATSADFYGPVMAQRKGMGRPMSVQDGEIAAIALQHGFTVATRNGKDFEALGLHLVDPFTA